MHILNVLNMLGPQKGWARSSEISIEGSCIWRGIMTLACDTPTQLTDKWQNLSFTRIYDNSCHFSSSLTDPSNRRWIELYLILIILDLRQNASLFSWININHPLHHVVVPSIKNKKKIVHACHSCFAFYFFSFFFYFLFFFSFWVDSE